MGVAIICNKVTKHNIIISSRDLDLIDTLYYIHTVLIRGMLTFLGGGELGHPWGGASPILGRGTLGPQCSSTSAS